MQFVEAYTSARGRFGLIQEGSQVLKKKKKPTSEVVEHLKHIDHGVITLEMY